MTATRERQEPLTEPAVRDEVLQLGPEGQLVGVLSRPPGAGAARTGTPTPGVALVILNAGVLHRVGPHRLHVTLGRRIAATGIASLRLDLGGIGDSVTTSDAASFRDSAVADTREAMTGLTGETGADRFVLFGVCAGADNSIATALADDRVAGIVLVDPPAYPTRNSQLRHLRMRLAERNPRDAVRWAIQLVAHRVRLATAMLGRRGVEDPPSEGRELPPVATFHAQLTRLVARGVRILIVYSGIHEVRYNHPDQLFELFPELRGRVDHAYFPTANHTFTELATQTELIAAVTSWMQKRFG
jgi:pimeloyl-ACP methyl ester carboxylesterase